jgi:hypothetical protein
MRRAIDRSFSTRLLQTSALCLALITASAAGVHAETVTVQGVDGANAADGVDPDGPVLPGGEGESVAANAGGVHPITSPQNTATAAGGNGGNGGANGADTDFSLGGNGGNSGAAASTAATSIASGPAEADAAAYGGSGGSGGSRRGVQWQWRGRRHRP